MQGQSIQTSANEQYFRSQETALSNRIKNQLKSKPQDKDHASQRRQTATPSIYIAGAPDIGREMHPNGRGNHRRDIIDESYLSPTRIAIPTQSKSDQTLNRLLQDQLELAYSDHQSNVKSAQSYAAIQHLRNFQPHLELSPNTSRHTSPCRSPSSLRQSPIISRRNGSSAVYKGYDAGSSGSERSFGSNKSAPLPVYLQVGRSKSATPSRTQSPNRQIPRCVSHNNSPSRSPVRHATLSPKHSNGALSGPSELVKHAHINLLWAFILDAIRSAHLDAFNESEPKQWWRKLFQTLKEKHGRG